MEKMFDSIIAFGGSTVIGSELGTDGSIDETKAFPQLVGNYFNVPVYNLAWSGGSNDRSFRLLPEALLKYPNSCVLFTYVPLSRSEVFDPALVEYFPTIPQDSSGYLPIGPNWLTLSIPSQLRNLINLYYKHFYNDSAKYNNYLSYNLLFYVQSVCQAYSNNLIHIFEVPEIFTSDTNAQQEIFENIDKKKILKFPGNKWNGWNHGFGNSEEWLTKSGYPRGKDHVLHEGHQAIANLIINHINNNVNLDNKINLGKE